MNDFDTLETQLAALTQRLDQLADELDQLRRFAGRMHPHTDPEAPQ